MNQLRENCCTILIDFGIPMKLISLMKMFLNKTYIEVLIGKHLYNTFPIQNGFEHCFQTLL
jgi:hypothetical protein